MIEDRCCPRCGTTIHEVLPRRPGRPRIWCSPRCRRAASEERRAAANGAIAIEYRQVETTLDDHVSAVLESPSACRRIIRTLSERTADGQLSDARWSGVGDEMRRMQPERRSQLRWGAG